MAEGYIGGFDTKHHYNYWRPVTAIREGGDKEWVSYLRPPHYRITLRPIRLKGLCGYGDGPVLQHRLRQFLNDERRTLPGHHPQVLELLGSSGENGASRVLCGIHFSTAVNAGYTQGACIGDWVFEHALRPASAPSASPASPVPEKAKTEGDSPDSLSSVESPN